MFELSKQYLGVEMFNINIFLTYEPLPSPEVEAP